MYYIDFVDVVVCIVWVIECWVVCIMVGWEVCLIDVFMRVVLLLYWCVMWCFLCVVIDMMMLFF